MKIRTRFAPSPTGFMHVGNLRTALYSYLLASHDDGTFVLRIEDTDKEREVKGAIDVIYKTLKTCGLNHQEGPDIGGEFGPYIQSERLSIYKEYAEKLVAENKAYRCFCTKERLETLGDSGYDRCCRDLSEEEIQKNLSEGKSYVIRLKMPLEGVTTFTDSVYGEISIENKELDDMIILKSDGYPTYNFANVIDDSLMQITHVVRGSEYLTSTPKYNILYDMLGFTKPTYVHLPLIMGKDEEGNISKLSKRHGSVSFEDLVEQGFLPETIVNYIALLGWSPASEEEIFSLDELAKLFTVDGIGKSSAVFDYQKLTWMNGEYIKNMSYETFNEHAKKYYHGDFDTKILHEMTCARISKFCELEEILSFLYELPEYDTELFINKKSKSTVESSKILLPKTLECLENLDSFDKDTLHDKLIKLAESLEVKNGTLLWPVRIAVSGTLITPGGAIEILTLLGKEESIRRIKLALDKLN